MAREIPISDTVAGAPASPVTFPAFLGIGAQKAGTTWLYLNLRGHPGIWLPKEKELHYFDESIEAWRSLRSKIFGMSGPDRRWRRQVARQMVAWRDNLSMDDLRWIAHYFLRRPNDHWYGALFAPGREKLSGEISPGYAMLAPDRVAYVHRLIPDARIIFFMRNPLERPWSQVLMEAGRLRRRKKLRPDEVQRHFRSEASRMRTDYVRTIDAWRSSYPEEQIFVGFLEDIHFRPEELLGRICRFLGVEQPPNWPDARRRVYGTTTGTIPAALAADLAVVHADLIEELDLRFGGHAAWWRFAAQQLRDGGGSARELEYPLYGSYLWRTWTDGRGNTDDVPPPLQSGTLAAVARR